MVVIVLIITLLLGELYSWVFFETFPLCSYVSFFHISYNSITMILVSVSSSCFTLAIPMREICRVGYTPRAWDPRSL